MERCIISNLQRRRKDGLIKRDKTVSVIEFHQVKLWHNNNCSSRHRYQALRKSAQKFTYLPRTRVAKTNAIDFMQSRHQDQSIISAKHLELRHNNTFHTAPNLDEKMNQQPMSFQLNISYFLTDNLRQHSNNSCSFSIKDFNSNC